ncbi:hypothetical protein HB825_04465 [Listeria booriae]|uniref:hypothetical protein n=1 Tax=Listeria booriae TaxID=1552123 RepID=UPI00164D86D2|nr:hypothetical protein [Listeria booriae]MBC6134089.1 hypothetical protein [Listeria booriae]
MDREILERLLKNALKRQTIVFIYNDTTRKDERYTGFVYLLTKDYVVLRKVSGESRAAGYVVMTLSTIFRVDDGGHQTDGKVVCFTCGTTSRFGIADVW